MKQQKTDKPTKYTHSVWSGKKYDKPMTEAELIAESHAILERHPTIGKLIRKPQ